MSFEHQLRPAFDTLTARLRDDLERHLEDAVEALSGHARTLAQSAHAEREEAIAAAVSEAQHTAELVAQARHQALQSDADARLRDVLERAEAQARDAELHLDEELQALRAEHQDELASQQQTFDDTLAAAERRFAQELDAAQARTLLGVQAADLASGARLVEAFRQIDTAQALSDILNTLSEAIAAEAPRSAIFLAGQAQVKSWRHHGFADGQGPGEVALADAGLVASALESREAVSVGGDGGEDGARAPEFARLGDDRGAIAVPMVVNDEVVALVYADQGPTGEVDRASWTATVEMLARHASRALEAMTAHRLAKSLGAGANRPRAVSKPADVVMPPPMPPSVRPAMPVPPAVDEATAEAQRMAQSLIAGIRADYDADIQAGVRDRDLMNRLSGPISQAWAQYEARVPESIRAATNFFHAEMVRTLANGDATLLTPRS